MKLLYATFLFMFGIIAVVLFHNSAFMPIWMSVTIFIGISCYLLQQYRQKTVGVLLLLLWLVYALPFVHIVPYLWFDFEVENPSELWGLAVNPYMLDEQIIILTAMIGAVGGLGFALGVSLNNKKIDISAGHISEKHANSIRALPAPIWAVWVSAAVLLSWLAAPKETLFNATYTSSASALDNANFDSAWLISHVLLIYSFCDAIVDHNYARKSFKLKLIVIAIAFVLIFLQLVRGNREAVPLVFSVLLIYFYWAAPLGKKMRFKLSWWKIGAGAFVLVVASMILGTVRYSLIETKNIQDVFELLISLAGSGVLGVSNLLNGTWSAVLLTPLSVAGDYIVGVLPLNFGEDYWKLILSVVPGFLADAIGYSRPIDSLHGPAWEMRYGLGGTHATVLPFMNFRMIGVFLIPAFWAYLFTCYEKAAMKNLNGFNLSLLGTIATSAPHFLWYGEKNGLNAMIIWSILGVMYTISLGIRINPRTARV